MPKWSYCLKFEWDENKNQENIKKHGVPFEEAKTVFFDENMLRWDDINHTDNFANEDRFFALGRSTYHNILIVCFCERENDIIRIITARKANKTQKEAYYASY